jgi:hypothetical protein
VAISSSHHVVRPRRRLGNGYRIRETSWLTTAGQQAAKIAAGCSCRIELSRALAASTSMGTTLIPKLLRSASAETEGLPVSKSTSMTKMQAEELLSRIDAKSAHFLRQLAANSGSITWGEMRDVFGIEDEDDWSAFSAAFGKGVTRALRHILQDKSARLMWWNDDDWAEAEEKGTLDHFKVYVDGPALNALREATIVTDMT